MNKTNKTFSKLSKNKLTKQGRGNIFLACDDVIQYLERLKSRLRNQEVFSTKVEIEMISQRIIPFFILLKDREQMNEKHGKSISRMSNEEFSKHITREIESK